MSYGKRIRQLLALVGLLGSAAAHAGEQPNILVIWGDSVGAAVISRIMPR